MRRETSNRIRFVIEELIPPILKDSFLFRWLGAKMYGPYISHMADFRKRAPFLTDEEYEKLYRNYPHVHSGTDNSAACLTQVTSDVIGPSVCDVGCGTGFLLNHIKAHANTELSRLVGTDFNVPENPQFADIEFIPAKIERLPFRDNEFDTVVCTHVIEHILDYRTAIAELRRVAARRLIIIVPMERESIYTFNPHFNFFPYPHSFLRAMHPVPKEYFCEQIGRDIYYREDYLA
ncbi:class I SAM-dependent methyltransferase [Microvirga soli]|uniref:class I SAM-dependent methyltransferase n=1 Tax=Microvirga soli TaxID=1854496 RepID=UPI00191D6794|nr:class I SAM-dependent methyltransferase [Microvirga soli]